MNKSFLSLVLCFSLGAICLHAQTPPAPKPEPPSNPAQTAAPFTNSLGLKFVAIPESTTLFCIYKTRVSDYGSFANATRREWHRPEFSQTANDPVVMVSWEDAMAFCNWLTKQEHASHQLPDDWKYRLPTEAEWNAAVGLTAANNKSDIVRSTTDQTQYPWGTDWPPPHGVGNYHQSLGVDSFSYTSPVGSFPANSLGIFDLGGNAWEWCMDRYNDSVDFRSLRGGSWNMRNPGDLLASAHVGNEPDIHLDTYGFRCAIERPTPPPPPEAPKPSDKH